MLALVEGEGGTDGFKPALAGCAILSLLATLAATCVVPARRPEARELEPAEVIVTVSSRTLTP
jgi:hypothetical protein